MAQAKRTFCGQGWRRAGRRHLRFANDDDLDHVAFAGRPSTTANRKISTDDSVGCSGQAYRSGSSVFACCEKHPGSAGRQCRCTHQPDFRRTAWDAVRGGAFHYSARRPGTALRCARSSVFDFVRGGHARKAGSVECGDARRAGSGAGGDGEIPN